MRTLGRVTHGVAWTAAAGLLALLVSTNCATPDISPGEVCDPNVPSCPAGFVCEAVTRGIYRCALRVVTCTDGDFNACPTNTTCFPPTGPGECKSPEQVACTFNGPAGGTSCTPGICPAGQACGTIIVNTSGSPSTACGCLPQPVK